MDRKHLILVVSLLLAAGTLDLARCEEEDEVPDSYMEESRHDPETVPFDDDDPFDRSDKTVETLDTAPAPPDSQPSDPGQIASAKADDMDSSTSDKVEMVKVQKGDQGSPKALHDSLVSQVVASNQQQAILLQQIQAVKNGSEPNELGSPATSGSGNNQTPLTPIQIQPQAKGQQQLFAQSADGQLYALTRINPQQASNLQAATVQQAQAQQLQLQAQVQQVQAAQLQRLQAQLAALTRSGGSPLVEHQPYFSSGPRDRPDVSAYGPQGFSPQDIREISAEDPRELLSYDPDDGPEHSAHAYAHHGEYFDEPQVDPEEPHPELQILPVQQPTYPKIPRTRTQAKQPEVAATAPPPPPPPPAGRKPLKVYVEQDVGPSQTFVEQPPQQQQDAQEESLSGVDVNSLIANVGLGYTPVEDTPHYTIYRVKDPDDEGSPTPSKVTDSPPPAPTPVTRSRLLPSPSPSYKSKFYSSPSQSSNYHSSPSQSSTYHSSPSPAFQSAPSPSPIYSSSPTFKSIKPQPTYQTIYGSPTPRVKPYRIVEAATSAPTYKEIQPPHPTKPQTVYKSSVDPHQYNQVKTQLILSFTRDRFRPFRGPPPPPPKYQGPSYPPFPIVPVRRPAYGPPPPPGPFSNLESGDLQGDTTRVREFQRKPFRPSPPDLGHFHTEPLFESHRRQPVAAHSITRPRTVHPPSFHSKYVDIDYSPGIALPPNEAAFAALQARKVGGPAFIDPGYLTSALGYELNGKILESLGPNGEGRFVGPPRARPTQEAQYTAIQPVVVKQGQKDSAGSKVKEGQREKPQVDATKVPPPPPPSPSLPGQQKKSTPVPKVELKDIKVSRHPLVPPQLLAKILKETTGDNFELENYYKEV